MTFFANKGGHRRIIWSQLFRFTALILPLATAASSAAYIVLANRWNPLAFWLGLATGAGIIMVILIVNCFTPVRRLPSIR